MRRQEVNVAFVYVPPTDLRALKTRTISVERWVLVLPQAHPLVKGKRVKLGDVKREPFAWFPRSVVPQLHDRVLAACHTAGLTLNIVQKVNNPATMLSLVASGSGDVHQHAGGENEAGQRCAEDRRRPVGHGRAVCYLEA